MGVEQVADPPRELPHTVAGVATGSANALAEGLRLPDAVVLAPPHAAEPDPTAFPHTVTGAAAGTAAEGPAVPAVEPVAVALFAGLPAAPHEPDDAPTELPQTITGVAAGAARPPLEPPAADVAAGDAVEVAELPPHCADAGPPALAALPHAVTGAVTGTLAPDADELEVAELEPPEPAPVEPLLVVESGALAFAPVGDSTEAALSVTFTGAVTGTSTAFGEPGVDALAATFAVVVRSAAEVTGWVTGLPAGPIATALSPTATGALTVVVTPGTELVEAGVAADAIPAPSSHAPPVKTPAYRHRLVQVFMKHLLRST